MTEQNLLQPGPTPVRLRAEDYLLLDGAGAFAAYEKTELLEGEIFAMNAQDRPHARLKIALYDALRAALAEAGLPLTVLVEASVALGTHNIPEPDLLLTSEPEGDGLVPLASVALVVEVADATLDRDLTRKAALYAHAGIPEYWVADVTNRLLHQMWRPHDGAYAERRTQPLGTALRGRAVAIAIHLPPA